MHIGRLSGRKWIAYLLVIVMFISIMPLGAIAGSGGNGGSSLETVQPVVVVTGTGIGGNTYTSSSIVHEKSYTLDELKALAGTDNYWVYSALNSFGFTNYYNGRGIPLTALFAESAYSGYDGEIISVYAADGYKVHFDPAGPDVNSDRDSNGNRTGGSFALDRHFFASTSITEGTQVPTILAWEQGGTKGSGVIPDEEDLEEIADLELMTGQVSTADMNNPLFCSNSKWIVAGDDITEIAVTIDGSEKTRAEILLMERAEGSYSYNTKGGERTDYVRGVPLAVLLSSYNDNDKISFTAADNWPVAASDMTKADLVEGNYLLAYEKGTGAHDLSGIYDTARNDASKVGYFTLYGDGVSPAKMINYISVTSSSGIDFSDSPYKHINNGGLTGQDGPYDIDAITGATLTIEGPGVEKSIALPVKELEEENAGAFRGVYTDIRDNTPTTLKYEGIRLSHVLNNMTSGDNGIILTDNAYKVLIKNRVRQTIAEFTLDQIAQAEEAEKPILVAYGTGTLDESNVRPFVYDGASGASGILGNEDGCIKLVYDKSVITNDQNTEYTQFGNMAYIFVAEETAPGFKHNVPPYSTPENSQYILTITGDKIGREVNYTVEELEEMVAYDPMTNAPVINGMGYRDEYSLANSTYWYVHEYEGVDLWKLLLKSGLPEASKENADKDTIVEFSATDGYKDFDKFTLEEIADPDLFGYYEKNPKDLNDGEYESTDEADLRSTGYPVLVAYGVNGYPYVIKNTLDGFKSGLSNDGGPLRIISGKLDYHHSNGSKQAKLLDKVIVGEDLYYSTHKYNPTEIGGVPVYQNIAENSALSVKVVSGEGPDGNVLKEVSYKVGEIEDILYGGTLTNAQLKEAKIKGFYEIEKNGAFFNDLYEGINLDYFLTDVVELPGYKGTITFSDGTNQLALSLEEVMGFTGVNGTTQLTGLSPVIAFGKNGVPMVNSRSAAGYESEVTLAQGTDYEHTITVKNNGGPLAVIFPKETTEAETADSLASLTSITINLVPDKYAHTEEPYNALAGNTINISGEGTRLTTDKDFTVFEIEGKQTMAVTGDYNIKSGEGETERRYRGIPLYDFLNSTDVGLKPNADEIIVTCADNSSYTFSLAEVYKSDYINGQNPEIDDLQMILAYGSAAVDNTDREDGLPLVIDEDSPGYNGVYGNGGGPIMLVVGQTDEDDMNSVRILKNVTEIEVTASEMVSWNHSTSQVYKQYLDETFLFQVVDTGNDIIFEKTYTVEELENMSSLIERESITWVGTDIREGINLWDFVLQEGEDITGIEDPIGVTVSASDGFSRDLRSVFGMDALINGIKDGSRYVPIIIAYAVDGYPLVPSSSSEGYTALAGNSGGPLRLMTHNNQGSCISNTVKLVVKVGSGGEEPPPVTVLNPPFTIKGWGDNNITYSIGGSGGIKNLKTGSGGKLAASFSYKSRGATVTDNVVGIKLSDLLAHAGISGENVLVTVDTTDNYQDASYLDIPMAKIVSDNYFVAYDCNEEHIEDVDEENNVQASLRIYRNFDNGSTWKNRLTLVSGITITLAEPEYTFDTYMGDGTTGNLPLAGVRSIWMDKDGGLWVSTYGGGVAYKADDSVGFTVYNKVSVPPLETAIVSAVAADEEGGVWMTQNASYTEPHNSHGAAYMKDGSITYYKESHVPATIPDNFVQEIQIDSQGNVWFGSGGGLTKYNPTDGTWTTWDKEDGFPAMSVDNLILDNEGGVWCGFYPDGTGAEDDLFTGGYAYMAEDGTITKYEYTGEYDEDIQSSLLADAWVRDIALDGKGGAWIVRSGSLSTLANVGGRVDYVSPDGEVTHYTGKDLLGDSLTGNGEIRMVVVDPSGGIWFGTSGDGIFHCETPGTITAQYSGSTNAWPEESTLDNIYSLDFIGNTLYAGSAGGLAVHEFTFSPDEEEDYQFTLEADRKITNGEVVFDLYVKNNKPFVLYGMQAIFDIDTDEWEFIGEDASAVTVESGVQASVEKEGETINQIKLSFLNLTQTGTPGTSAYIGRFKLKAVSDGIHEIALREYKVFDKEGDPLDCVHTSASVNAATAMKIMVAPYNYQTDYSIVGLENVPFVQGKQIAVKIDDEEYLFFKSELDRYLSVVTGEYSEDLADLIEKSLEYIDGNYIEFVYGKVNDSDEEINVGDAVTVINTIIENKFDQDNETFLAMDVNGDNTIDVADAQEIINYWLHGTPFTVTTQ